jgi:hypothetical protein
MEPQQPGSHALAGRRADAGTIRLSERDIAGLVLCGEQYGAPYDLLAGALEVRADRLRGIVARWRRAGYALTGTLGPGPAWCWLTPSGMAVTGLRYPAARPALARLAHIRAVLAIRLWLEAGDAYREYRAWWRCERRIRAAAARIGTAHVPDAEIHWPSLDGSPYAGQVWAIEVELTPKAAARTGRIITELLTAMQYAQVVYLTAPAARPLVTRIATGLSPWEQARVVVRDLPPSAFMPEPPR